MTDTQPDHKELAQQQAEELDRNMHPDFKNVKLSVLKNVIALNQDRNFSEEVDELEKLSKQNGGSEKNPNDWLLKSLKTDLKQGLNEKDFPEREQSYGHNRREIVASKSFCSLFYAALDDFTLKILIVCAFVSIIMHMATAPDAEERKIAWVDGVAILIAVLICSLVGAGNDWQKEKQFQELNQVSDKMKLVQVYRNGQLLNVHRDNIYTGDIISIVSGIEIPSDGIVIEGIDITTDESALTGEPDPVHKAPLQKCIERRNQIKQDNGGKAAPLNRHEVPSPVLMSGTGILSGEGKYLVTVVGKNSCQGIIEEKLKQKEDQPTPLQQKLDVIAEDIGKFGGYSAICIIIVMLIRFTIERVNEDEFQSKHLNEILHFFIIGVTVVVVAIPEGLPLSVTLSLAFSTKKMLADKNLVRKMQACETMGGANNICSDKTGTLTMNKMDLSQLWNSKEIKIDVNSSTLNLNDFIPKAVEEIVLQTIAINNGAEISEKKDADGKIQVQELGNASDLSFLKFLKKCSFDWNKFSSKFECTYKIPFSSSRKMMSKVILVNGKRRLIIKGASEIVMEGCSKTLNWETGAEEDITNTIKSSMEQAINKFADDAMRTLCVAYKNLGSNESDVEKTDAKGIHEIEKQDLVFVALCGIRDNLRPEVPGAVKQCQISGITVRMVTGDNVNTARAIGKMCNIYDESKGHQVILGEEFMRKVGPIICKKCRTVTCPCPVVEKEEEKEDTTKKDDKKGDKYKEEGDIENAKKKKEKLELRVDCLKNQDVFREIYPKLTVMARSRPDDKYAFVLGLRDENQVVAVTGDGTNDAPALKKADVGFAMGIAGTDTAKKSSDIILTDDNFSSIVKAVLWGRNIYDSIRKFLQFQLTVNVVAVVVTLIGAAVSKQDFLKPIQMLWVNLIMDTFASLALATEPPLQKLLDRPPHSRDDYIVSRKMFKHIIWQSFYQLIVIFIIAFDGENFIPEVVDALDEQKDFRFQYKYNLQKFTFNDYGKEQNLFCTSGRLKSYDGFDEEYSEDAEDFTPSRHFTFLFNAFVMMQFFNFLNARKIEDEYNIFSGICANWLFFAILFIIIVLQFIFVTFGGVPLHCYIEYGLTGEQWLYCIIFGIGGNIVNLLIKPINEEKYMFCCIKKRSAQHDQTNGKDEQQDRDQNRKNSKILNIKKDPLRRLSSQMGSSQRKFSKDQNQISHHKGQVNKQVQQAQATVQQDGDNNNNQEKQVGMVE